MIYIYFLSILLLFILSYYFNKKDLISPSFIFTFGFFFQSIWVLLYSKKWELSMHLNTFLVITTGILAFIVISKLTTILFKKISHNNIISNNLEYISIEKWKKIGFLLFSIFTCVIYLNFIINSVNGSISNIGSYSSYISQYDKLVKFSETSVRVPFLIGNIKLAVVAIGVWFLFVSINNYIQSKRVEVIDISIIIVCSILSILNGSRTPLFFIMAAGVSFIFISIYKKNKRIGIINHRMLFKLSVLGVIFLCFFASFAKLLGRNIKTNSMDYLAIYCGAEVKNLDLFLQENKPKNNKYFGTQTFRPIITTLGRKIGIKDYEDYKLDLPFRKVGNYELGNVYTTFYPYIYDFGYFGMLILVIIMSCTSQIIYSIIINNKKSMYSSVWIVAYGFVFSCLLLSFFSNKFYENIFTFDFIKRLIVWYICTWFFCKFNYKKILKRENKNEI